MHCSPFGYRLLIWIAPLAQRSMQALEMKCAKFRLSPSVQMTSLELGKMGLRRLSCSIERAQGSLPFGGLAQHFGDDWEAAAAEEMCSVYRDGLTTCHLGHYSRDQD